jgi:hypothetical protein
VVVVVVVGGGGGGGGVYVVTVTISDATDCHYTKTCNRTHKI